MSSNDLAPQLPYVQVHRSALVAIATLAGRRGLDWARLLGLVVAWWAGLADRRRLAAALEVGQVVVSADELRRHLLDPGGVTTEDLEDAGLLAPISDVTWRVRGMSRYLEAERVRLSRVRRATLSRPPPNSDTTTLRPPSDPPPTPQRTPLRPPSDPTEERGERREERRERRDEGSARRRARARPVDDAHAPTVRALVDAGATLDGGRGAATVAALLALARQGQAADPGAEVLARWRRASRHEGYPVVRTLSELRTTWGHWGPPAGSAVGSGPVTAVVTEGEGLF